MEIRPIGDIFRVNPPDRKSAIKKSNETREGQDIYDQSDASGHRKKRQDIVEISQAYHAAKQAYKDNNQK